MSMVRGLQSRAPHWSHSYSASFDAVVKSLQRDRKCGAIDGLEEGGDTERDRRFLVLLPGIDFNGASTNDS
ncbi:hypothetical protein GCM10010442_66400 [Kitasatospora kifunensis]